MKNLFKLLFAALFVVSFTSCGTSIEPGEEGFLFSKFGDGVQKEVTYNEGFEWHAPWNDIITYDTREKTLDLNLTDVLDNNGLSLGVDVALMFKVQKGKSATLHTTRGVEYVDNFVHPVSVGAIRQVVKKYTAAQIYSGQVDNFEQQVFDLASKDLMDNNITLTRVILKDIDPPAKIAAAIEAKEAQKEANLKSELFKEEQTNIANANIEKARGVKESKILEAQGEAQSIQLKQQALRQSPQYVELVKAENWDGKLPQYMTSGSGGGMFIDLRNKQ